MYENIVMYKGIFMWMGAIALILFGILSIVSARMFQGDDARTLTGPLYSTSICIGVVAVMGIISEYLIYKADKISLAVGISLMIFSLMILFTVSGLCLAAKCYKKPVASTLKRRPFDNLFR
jgi:hypothetical protein